MGSPYGGVAVRIDLPADLETVVREKVESGLYHDSSAVVAEALRLLEERDRLRRLRAALAVGLEQIERGEVVPNTPELHAEVLRTARRMAQEGVTPDPDVVP